MFLKFNHRNLDVYTFSKKFVLECYKLTEHFPSEEKFGMIGQIRKAGLSIHLNMAEGSSRKSEVERKRFYEISRGSVIEIDAALDIAKELKYLDRIDLNQLQESMTGTFKILSGLITSKGSVTH